MFNYVDNIQDELRNHLKELEDRIKATPVKWAYGPALAGAKLQLDLAKLGVHRVQNNICNCGLIVERGIKLGHRVHGTKTKTREIQLVIEFNE